MMCTRLKDVFHRFYQVVQNKNLSNDSCVEDSWYWYLCWRRVGIRSLELQKLLASIYIYTY